MADYISQIKLPNNSSYNIKDSEAARGNARIFYGTCNTPAATAIKTIICNTYDTLTAGDLLIVKFTVTNTASVNDIALIITNSNDESTSSVSIKKQYNNDISNLNNAGELNSDTIATFVYNGTYWILINGNYDTTYTSLSASENGSAVSLVTTGEKYIWNNKGTISSITAGSGLTGGTITNSGTIGLNLLSSTLLSDDAYSDLNRIYPVALDASGYVVVQVPWTNSIIIAGDSNSTSNAANTSEYVYLNLINSTTNTNLNSSLRLATQDEDTLTISSNANGIITFHAVDTTYDVFDTNANGLVPAPADTDDGEYYYYLRADGTWAIPPHFELSVASTSVLGGIKVFDPNNNSLTSKQYPVLLDSDNKAYVDVPWTDNDYRVKSIQTSTNAAYQLLFSKTVTTADNISSDLIEEVRRSDVLTFNPSNSTLYIDNGTTVGTLTATAFSGTASNVTGIITVDHGGTGTTTTSANYVFAGSITDDDAAPSFRALVVNDIPSLPWSKIDLNNQNMTLSDYNITDVGIDENGLVTLGSNTFTPILSVNGHTGTSITLHASDLNLASALRFVGTTTDAMDSTFDTIPDIGDDNYIPSIGDVVLQEDAGEEFVCIAIYDNTDPVTYQWESLGPASSFKPIQTAVDTATDSEEPTTTFVSAVTQDTLGVITVTTSELLTTGEWLGNAASADILSTAREIYVNLASTRSDVEANKIYFDGSASVGIHVDGILGISHGGTGTGTAPTQYGIIYAASTTAYASTAAGTAGQLLIGTSTAPSWYNGLILSGTSANDYVADFKGQITFNGTDDYGDAYTPIYWKDGKPSTVKQVISVPFTIPVQTNSKGIKVYSTAITANSYVIKLVVTDGMSSLNGPLTATTAAGYVQISSTVNIGSTAVGGYVLIERGGTLPSSGTDSITGTALVT